VRTLRESRGGVWWEAFLGDPNLDILGQDIGIYEKSENGVLGRWAAR
jgi:hypothetical protein